MGSGRTPRNGRRVDRHRDGGEPAPGDDLGQQPAEGVPDDGRLLLEPADDRVEVVGDLADGLVREDLGVGVGLLHRVGVVRPARRQRGVAGLLEQRRPAVPAARQEPEAVDEDDRRQTGPVGAVDLLVVVLGDGRGCLGAGHRGPPPRRGGPADPTPTGRAWPRRAGPPGANVVDHEQLSSPSGILRRVAHGPTDLARLVGDPGYARAAAERLQALATPSRLRILARLHAGPASVTDLAAAVGMEGSAVSPPAADPAPPRARRRGAPRTAGRLRAQRRPRGRAARPGGRPRRARPPRAQRARPGRPRGGGVSTRAGEPRARARPRPRAGPRPRATATATASSTGRSCARARACAPSP